MPLFVPSFVPSFSCDRFLFLSVSWFSRSSSALFCSQILGSSNRPSKSLSLSILSFFIHGHSQLTRLFLNIISMIFLFSSKSLSGSFNLWKNSMKSSGKAHLRFFGKRKLSNPLLPSCPNFLNFQYFSKSVFGHFLDLWSEEASFWV